MTYREMQQAEAEYSAAVNPKQKKQRGATKAQIQRRAQVLNLCVVCSRPLSTHTREQMLDCATARS